MGKCPRCGSADVSYHGYLGIRTIRCNSCGFDESSVYEVYPEQKTSQKAKGKYAVYKTGGARRTVKKSNKN